MHGSFYRDEGDKRDKRDKRDVHHRALVSEEDPGLIFSVFDPEGMGYGTQNRLPLGSSLQAHLQE